MWRPPQPAAEALTVTGVSAVSTVAHYLLHGLRIASEVMLPAAAPSTGDRSDSGHPPNGRVETDVQIDLLDYRPVGAEPPPGTLILDHHVHGHRHSVAARTGERVQLRLPGYGDFFGGPDGLGRILCAPDPRVGPGHLPILLTDHVLPFFMGLAGYTVLRAGAVEVADGAIAVAGPRGVGTSTLTAWLCATGARLVTDGALRLDRDGTCHRGGLEIRLRDHAVPVDAGLVPSSGRVRRTVDGRRGVRPDATSSACLPLRAVVVPRPVSDSRGPAVHRMEAASAAVALARATHTLGWRSSAPMQALRATTATVAAQVGVHVVDMPWGPPFGPDMPQRLLDLLEVNAPTPAQRRRRPVVTAPTPI